MPDLQKTVTDATGPGVSRAEFAGAVDGVISSVYHLYREVDRLMLGLRDALTPSPDPLSLVRGTLGRSGKDQSRLVIRNELGAIFIAKSDARAEDEGADEEPDNSEEDDEEEKAVKSPPVELAGDAPVLAVRVAMYHPQSAGEFEPQIQYAVLKNWKIGRAEVQPGDTILLARYMLRKVPRSLAHAAGATPGAHLPTKAAVKAVPGRKRRDDRLLSCKLPAGVRSVPLYALDSAGELNQLADQMKEMWRAASRRPVDV